MRIGSVDRKRYVLFLVGKSMETRYIFLVQVCLCVLLLMETTESGHESAEYQMQKKTMST